MYRQNKSKFACIEQAARLAQSVERQPFKLVVVGSSPTVGILVLRFFTTGSVCFFWFPLAHQVPKGLWRNGSASDSRSDGWAFESLWPQVLRHKQNVLVRKLKKSVIISGEWFRSTDL